MPVSQTMRTVEAELAKYRPLSASQVARIYGLDKTLIITACQLFAASRGKRGLRCYRSARKYYIRPESVNAWIAQLEEDTANADRLI